jgi:para-nitrobenzyl esterase
MISNNQSEQAATDPVPVTVDTFIRAETDHYFAGFVAESSLGQVNHRRGMVPIDRQTVVRMNRDTLYSDGIFDLDAGPVTITLPDAGNRFMSMQVISQDHLTVEVVYAPGSYTYTRERVGTRYVATLIRTLANPEDPDDVRAANAAQDGIRVIQAASGEFVVPNWDPVTLTAARDALSELAALGYSGVGFGTRDEVNPISHLIGTAIGWGGNPPYAATYVIVYPATNDGATVHRLDVADVPVDGFWSISVYNADGFFEPNDRGAYSVNNLTADPNPDGSLTIQFGGCAAGTANCLPITPGWNYVVRLYRPRPEILDGSWTFPAAQPLT